LQKCTKFLNRGIIDEPRRTLKTEMVLLRKYATSSEDEAELHEYIEFFYNRQRIQKKLGYCSCKIKFDERFGFLF
jgi:transposase InsO family protein